MPGRHPCERGQRCSCHRAGPSTIPLPSKKTILLTTAALVCPVLAAPTPPIPTHLPFLYPVLDKRVTDAGQAPDDPSEGFEHQHIQLADLIRAGLPYKYVYDPDASATEGNIKEEIELKESGGAWVIDNSWALHGRRFGPLSATATADITDDPLPTPTESIPPASTPTATATATSPPTVLAIQSSLPTGWDSRAYARSDMYAIPLVVSFALVIALMIGSLIGAMVIRRDRSRSRRRKKRIIQGDDDSAREKVAQSSLVSRVGRALKHRDDPDEPQQEENPRTELEQRVKSWARRSAAWRVQARLGVRRRMGRGRKRSQADNGPGSIGGAIQEEPEAEEREGRTSTRAPSPVQTRVPTPVVTEPQPEPPTPGPAPNYASPTVPTYASPPSAAGPSTARQDPLTRIEAHPDATPSDEPAYDGPGSGDGLPPAYRGGGLSEVARGKRPAHTPESLPAPDDEPQPEPRRVWTELDAYAFGQDQDGQAITAHVATDDKRVLERLHSMRGAPDEDHEHTEGEAPREEDVFGFGSGPSSPSASTPATSNPSGSELAGVLPLPPGTGVLPPPPGTGVLPLPPTKTGTGPVARYGEADLCLPRYLDQEGMERVEVVSGRGEMVPSAPEGVGGMGGVGLEGGGLVPSAPPCEETTLPSAPPCEGDMTSPSAPPCEEEMALPSAPVLEVEVPSAPPLHDHHVASAPPLDDDSEPLGDSVPSAPPLDDHALLADDHAAPASSAPLQDDALHPDDKTSLLPSNVQSPLAVPGLRRVNSSSPLLDDERQ